MNYVLLFNSIDIKKRHKNTTYYIYNHVPLARLFIVYVLYYLLALSTLADTLQKYYFTIVYLTIGTTNVLYKFKKFVNL